MKLGNLPFIIPYILSFLISLTVGVITWQRREVIGAKAYSITAFGQASISFGYIMELTRHTLRGKLFWDDFQWIGLIIWATLIPIFSLQFTRSDKANRPRTSLLLSLVPTLFFLLLISNPWHGLIHHDEYVIRGEPFSALRYDFTPTVWIFSIYGYIAMGFAFANLLASYFRTDPIYRSQVGAIVIGAGIPLIGYMFVLLGITMTFQRDISPLTFAVGNVIVAWGLLHYRLFDIVPIAWGVVIENMSELVVVTDPMYRIVGINTMAKEGLDMDSQQIIGKPVLEVFAPWKKEIRKLEGQTEGHIELPVTIDGEQNYFEVKISPLRDQKGKFLGQVFVARNITHQKEMERELRLLNSNLEELVQERTQELAEAYDSTLEGWAKALEIRDKETEGHSRRVTELTVQLAHEIGLSDENIEQIRRGALIHDIGKMAIPDNILHKPGILTDNEWEVMKQHPAIAEKLLSHISYLKKALEIPCYHHERWDGGGYPKGLKGEEIPLSARLFTLVDNWDALLSDRPYRKAWPQDEVIQYFHEQSGKIFDPNLTDVFLSIVDSRV